MSIGNLFNISTRTMSVYQRAIDVASQNISNANNADYARQKVILATEETQGGRGMGVKIQDIARIKNDMLDSQIRKYQSSLSDSNRRSELLKQIESIIAEPSETGLSTYMADFFTSWDKLTTNPTSIQLRNNIVQKATSLSNRFKDTLDGLADVQSVLQKEASLKVEDINSYLKDINTINQKIFESSVRGDKANELKDQSDAIIDKLSKLVNISVQTNENGASVVNVGGIQGADQNTYTEFEMKIVNGQMRMVSKSDPNSIALLTGGEIFAATDLYSNKIPSYKAAYENLANTFISKVNEIHMKGFTLTQGGVSNTGIPFFGELDGSGNVVNAFVDGAIVLNNSVKNDSRNIAASDAANNDGNGNTANGIARLTDTKLPELNGESLIENYTSILNDFGKDKVLNDNNIQTGDTVMQQLQAQKSSYSGVSIDEEMTNVLKFQRTYDAAAKLIKVADDMLKTIVELV